MGLRRRGRRGQKGVPVVGPATTGRQSPVRRHRARSPLAPGRGSGGATSDGSSGDKYSATDTDAIKDFARYPELAVPRQARLDPDVGAGAATCFLIGGWSGLPDHRVSSCRTCCCWHSTFTVNSLAHVFGRRRYDTVGHRSRNNIFVALLTGGEGLAQQPPSLPVVGAAGVFFWWEIDVVLLRAQAVGSRRASPRPIYVSRRREVGAIPDLRSHRTTATEEREAGGGLTRS